MRFHDVRHMTVTLLLRLKVPMQIVQRIARHSNIRLNRRHLRPLDVSALRELMETWGDLTLITPDARQVLVDRLQLEPKRSADA